MRSFFVRRLTSVIPRGGHACWPPILIPGQIITNWITNHAAH
jgi:hypothetical protein